MKCEPMLARSIEIDSCLAYVEDPSWWMEQKLDGQRLLLRISDGVVHAYSRNGEPTTVDPTIHAAFAPVNGEWHLDGEWFDGRYCLFDLPGALVGRKNLITPDNPFEERRSALESVYNAAWAENPHLHLISTARTLDEKRALLETCVANGAEGVMLKATSGKYRPGKRSTHMLKAKFTKTADCVILQVRREGKLSSAVGLFDNGTLVDVGSIKMTDRDLDRTKPGDVVEVRYLYATKDQRLYQPVFLKFRNDKHPTECTIDQLQYTNKQVFVP